MTLGLRHRAVGFQIWTASALDATNNDWNLIQISFPDKIKQFNLARLQDLTIYSKGAATFPTLASTDGGRLAVNRGDKTISIERPSDTHVMVTQGLLEDDAGWSLTWTDPFPLIRFQADDNLYARVPPADANTSPTGDYYCELTLRSIK